jgi:hypothetical protein
VAFKTGRRSMVEIDASSRKAQGLSGLTLMGRPSALQQHLEHALRVGEEVPCHLEVLGIFIRDF